MIKSIFINDIEFFHDPDKITFTDDVMDELIAFSLYADEKTYSIYYEGGELVIF